MSLWVEEEKTERYWEEINVPTTSALSFELKCTCIKGKGWLNEGDVSGTRQSKAQ